MTTHARYTKTSVTIEAVRFDGTNAEQINAWTGEGAFVEADPDDRGDDPEIIAVVWDKLHSTWVGVKSGQWIIRGVQGEFYPCDPDVFAMTYESAAPDPLADHPRAAAIRTVARHILADAAEEVGATQWDGYPDIGEGDWEAVAAELQRLAPPVDGTEYHAAYGTLADATADTQEDHHG